MTCVICGLPTRQDDIAIAGDTRGCVCLRCYKRETGAAGPPPEPLRQALRAALDELAVR
jgi:hypothetical protein